MIVLFIICTVILLFIQCWLKREQLFEIINCCCLYKTGVQNIFEGVAFVFVINVVIFCLGCVYVRHFEFLIYVVMYYFE